MDLVFILLLFVLGSCIGSFLGAYSYRWPLGISIKRGRSFCPSCKKQIEWYDNIPLFSYLALSGKCRKCKSKISVREPLIELAVGVIFVGIYFSLAACSKAVTAPGGASQICSFSQQNDYLELSYFLFIAAALWTIFVIDFENQLIPDEVVFLLLLTAVSFNLLFLPGGENLYTGIFVGFGSSVFLLSLHLATRGRGMGLGDVKLAIPLGIILGWPSSVAWLFLSFVIGAIIGVFLIFIGKAKFGKEISFGPFLITAFFIILIWGNIINNTFFPYLK